MGYLRLFGYSDDLVEVEGDLSEEFDWYADDPNESRLLAISDGHLLRIRYDEDGIWRLSVAQSGTAKLTKTEGRIGVDNSDTVELDGDNLTWVVFGLAYAAP